MPLNRLQRHGYACLSLRIPRRLPGTVWPMLSRHMAFPWADDAITIFIGPMDPPFLPCFRPMAGNFFLMPQRSAQSFFSRSKRSIIISVQPIKNSIAMGMGRFRKAQRRPSYSEEGHDHASCKGFKKHRTRFHGLSSKRVRWLFHRRS